MGLFDNPNIDWGSLFGAPGAPTTPGMPTGVPSTTFNDRFGAAFPRAGTTPPVPGVQPNQSPISPEAMAAQLAARGVPPPPADVSPVVNPGDPIRMDPAATQAWRDDPMSTGPGAVGAALTGKTIGAPTDIRTDTQKVAEAAPTDVSASAKKPDDAKGGLAEALKGVKAPTAPEIQRLGTPAAPKPLAAKSSNDLLALLQTLNAGTATSGMKLPQTLGAALGRG